MNKQPETSIIRRITPSLDALTTRQQLRTITN